MSEFLDQVEMRGYKKGVSVALTLVKYLIDHDRLDDLDKLSDDNYCNKLLNEIFINKQ